MKQLVGLFVLCLMTSVTSVFAQVSTAKWQPEPIKIDGNGSDWGILPRFFNTETNLKYEFRNDSENLYFVLKASDQLMQMQLIKAGFSLKFKLKNANLDKVEISFKPNITEANQIGSAQNGVQARLVDKFSASPEAILSDTVYLDGFKYTKGMITSRKKDEGIFFARSKNPRELVWYEFRIPLRELFGDNFKIENVSTIPMQLQVTVNNASAGELKQMKSSMRGSGRGMGGERGGMSGGGMSGGGMRGGGMRGGGMPGGEMSGGNSEEMGAPEMAGNSLGGDFSMERKSFSKDFQLSSGK